MSTQQVRTSIDDVLHTAVDSGAVPNVAAIAADRDGIIYEGAAGPRAPAAATRRAWTPTSGSCR